MLRSLDPNANLGLKNASDSDLTKVVQKVHGVPRALEVIASILAHDPFATLDEILIDFFQREEVTKELVKANYNRLDADTQKVVEALAIYGYPVPSVAVDFLLEPFSGKLNLSRILNQLSLTNVISINKSNKTVTLHPIDQDYIYNQIPQLSYSSYTLKNLHHRAAQYYIQINISSDKWKNVDDIQELVFAIDHFKKADEYLEMFNIIKLIDNHLILWGNYQYLITLYQFFISYPKEDDLEVKERCYGYLAHIYVEMGNLEEAKSYYQKALEIARKTINKENQADWLRGLGNCCRKEGLYTNAITFYEQALILSNEIYAQEISANILNKLGACYRAHGEIQQAINLYNKALNLIPITLINHENLPNRSISLGSLGYCYSLKGEIDNAIKYYQEAILIERQTQDRPGLCIDLYLLALTFVDLDMLVEAEELCYESLTLADDIGIARGQNGSRLVLGLIFLISERLQNALNILIEATKYNYPQQDVQVQILLGVTYLLYHDELKAKQAFMTAIEIADTLLHKSAKNFEALDMKCVALIGMARCTYQTKYLFDAKQIFQEARKITNEKGVLKRVLLLISKLPNHKEFYILLDI